MTLFDEKGAFAEVGGDYGEEGFIYQALAPLPEFDGQKAVLGSWIVGQESAGVGIRESTGPITTNRSRFVPPQDGVTPRRPSETRSRPSQPVTGSDDSLLTPGSPALIHPCFQSLPPRVGELH